jgi:hypothetical protein
MIDVTLMFNKDYGWNAEFVQSRCAED